MTIYDQPLRNQSIRQLHHQEQLQAKIKQESTANAATATSEAAAATSSVLSATLTPASVSAQSVESQVFTVSGVTTDMNISIISQPATDGRILANSAVATDADEVTIYFNNSSAGARTPASGEYKFMAVR